MIVKQKKAKRCRHHYLCVCVCARARFVYTPTCTYIDRLHLLTARPHTGRMARARMERLPKHDLVWEREGESEKARGTEGGRDREEEEGGYHQKTQLSTQMHTKHTNTRIIT